MTSLGKVDGIDMNDHRKLIVSDDSRLPVISARSGTVA
jgi:hypothetical protein